MHALTLCRLSDVPYGFVSGKSCGVLVRKSSELMGEHNFGEQCGEFL